MSCLSWSRVSAKKNSGPATREIDQIAGKTRYSIEYGPVLLAAVGEGTVDLVLEKGSDAESLGRHLESVAGAPLHYTLRETPSRKLVPYYQIADERFTCYPTISIAT